MSVYNNCSLTLSEVNIVILPRQGLHLFLDYTFAGSTLELYPVFCFLFFFFCLFFFKIK